MRMTHKNSRPVLAIKYMDGDAVRAVAEFDVPGHEHVYRITKVRPTYGRPSGYHVTFVDGAEPLFVARTNIVDMPWALHWIKD